MDLSGRMKTGHALFAGLLGWIVISETAVGDEDGSFDWYVRVRSSALLVTTRSPQAPILAGFVSQERWAREIGDNPLYIDIPSTMCWHSDHGVYDAMRRYRSYEIGVTSKFPTRTNQEVRMIDESLGSMGSKGRRACDSAA